VSGQLTVTRLVRSHIVTIGVTSLTAQIGDEEVDVVPIYRDPIHDFGFLRFDPTLLKFGRPPSIRLNPDGCRVGTEIRVIGNDAGERRQVLSGVIARTDRNTPEYGRLSWNDANTFYIGAASSTSGGSSGSPIINKAGEAIALNAGGSTQAASSMYLPLNPAVRALARIQKGEYVPRGDCHTVFEHVRFHDALRAGVPASVIDEVRDYGLRAHIASGGSRDDADAGATGMLQVTLTLRGGVSGRSSRLYDRMGARKGFLQTGDVLYKINGKLVCGFWPLEVALDAAMEKAVENESSSSPTPAGDDDAADEDDDEAEFSAPWTSARWGDDEADQDFDEAVAAASSKAMSTPERPRKISLPDEPPSAVLTAPQWSVENGDTPASHPSAASHGREVLGSVDMSVIRSGKVVEVTIPVVDAHALVPRRVLQVGGAGIAEMSVSRAMRNGHPQGLVVINPPGFVFADAGRDVILRAVEGMPIRCFADAVAALAVVPEDSYFTVSVSELHNPSGMKRSVVCYMTRRFHPARILSRHVADDCSAGPPDYSRWHETLLPDLSDAAKREGKAQDLGSLPGLAAILGPDDREDLMHIIRDALNPFDLSLNAVGGGGLAGEGLTEDEEGEEVPDGEEEEEYDDDEEDGQAVEIDGRALLMAGTGPEGKAMAEKLVAESLRHQFGGKGEEIDEEAMKALVGAIVEKAQEATEGVVKAVKGQQKQAMHEYEKASKAMAKAVRRQRLQDLEEAPPGVRKAAMALVGVETRIPLPIDGVEGGGLEEMLGMGSAAAGNATAGVGVVMDSKLGIILVDRSTIPIYMAVVHVVVGAERVPGRVLFVSPTSNFALVQVDLQGRGGGLRLADIVRPVEFCPEAFSLRDASLAGKKAKSPSSEEHIWHLALTETGGIESEKDDIYQDAKNIAKALPAFGKQAFSTWRVVNLVGYSCHFSNGIMVDSKGRLVALVTDMGDSDSVAVSAEWLREPVNHVVERLRTGSSPIMRDLGVQLRFVPVMNAQAEFNMAPTRVAKLMNRTVEGEIIAVEQVCSGSSADDPNGLQPDDVILDLLPDDWPEPDAVRSEHGGWGMDYEDDEDDDDDDDDDDDEDDDDDGEQQVKSLSSVAKGASAMSSKSDVSTPNADDDDDDDDDDDEDFDLDGKVVGHKGGVMGWLRSTVEGLFKTPPEPRPTFKEDLKRPVQLESVAELILRCRSRESVRLRVLRRGMEVCVTAKTDPVDVRGASKVVVQWQGLTMTPPDAGLLRRGDVPWVGLPDHRGDMPPAVWNNGAVTPHKPSAAEMAALALYAGKRTPGNKPQLMAMASAGEDAAPVEMEARLPAGVICCYCESGTEASSSLAQAYWVLKIGSTPVPTIDDVLYVTSRLPDRAPVTVTLGEILSGQTKVITLRPDSSSLPLLHFIHGPRFVWERTVVREAWSPGQSSLRRQSSLSTGAETLNISRSESHPADTGARGPSALALVGVGALAGAVALGAYVLVREHQRRKQATA
jgi:S1-C subfamily serine protease